jgi:hypothetical protein
MPQNEEKFLTRSYHLCQYNKQECRFVLMHRPNSALYPDAAGAALTRTIVSKLSACASNHSRHSMQHTSSSHSFLPLRCGALCSGFPAHRSIAYAGLR